MEMFLVLVLVAAAAIGASTAVCMAGDGDESTQEGDPEQINPSCEPVAPTSIILELFWNAVDALADCMAAVV